MKLHYSALLLFLHTLPAAAQTHWSFELQGGVVHNLRLPLVIHQKGYDDITIQRAHYYSEPLNDPPYGVWRISKWFTPKNKKGGSILFEKKSIEFEYLHHKIYLKNKPSEVQDFGISHGFNMLMLNHGMQRGKIIFRAGLGSVLIHPESTIRGLEYPVGPGFDWKGYRLRGLMVNLAVARPIKISKSFFINSEFKVNGAVVNALVVNGYARVHVIVFQLTLGPGVKLFIRQ